MRQRSRVRALSSPPYIPKERGPDTASDPLRFLAAATMRRPEPRLSRRHRPSRRASRDQASRTMRHDSYGPARSSQSRRSTRRSGVEPELVLELPFPLHRSEPWRKQRASGGRRKRQTIVAEDSHDMTGGTKSKEAALECRTQPGTTTSSRAGQGHPVRTSDPRDRD